MAPATLPSLRTLAGEIGAAGAAEQMQLFAAAGYGGATLGARLDGGHPTPQPPSVARDVRLFEVAGPNGAPLQPGDSRLSGPLSGESGGIPDFGGEAGALCIELCSWRPVHVDLGQGPVGPFRVRIRMYMR